MSLLVNFDPDQDESAWIENERRTAELVRLLWGKCPASQRSNLKFLKALISATWINTNNHDDVALERRRRWRNRYLSEWLVGHGDLDDDDLAKELSKKIRISRKDAESIINQPSGFSHFYKGHRECFWGVLKENRLEVYRAFSLVSRRRADHEGKAREVAEIICRFSTYETPRGESNFMYGLSPVLACLDPQSRFPVVNKRVVPLLRVVGEGADANGAVALARLIGQSQIYDSFYLDVFACNREDEFPDPPRARREWKLRELGFKDEQQGILKYAKGSARIRKLHNKLTNKFKRAMQWRGKVVESEFDALIEDWHPSEQGRYLLIEAKTATEGSNGRTQLRQAIGQLFDYRWRSFEDRMDKVDLALLTPDKPSREVLRLLEQLGIESLWFEGNNLRGTINLM